MVWGLVAQSCVKSYPSLQVEEMAHELKEGHYDCPPAVDSCDPHGQCLGASAGVWKSSSFSSPLGNECISSWPTF